MLLTILWEPNREAGEPTARTFCTPLLTTRLTRPINVKDRQAGACLKLASLPLSARMLPREAPGNGHQARSCNALVAVCAVRDAGRVGPCDGSFGTAHARPPWHFA